MQVVLRASGAETLYTSLLRCHGLEDVVILAPLIDHCEALEEQLAADALLLFQGREFNPQIPAKVYEYLRGGKPILALPDQAGETAKLIGAVGVGQVVPIDDSEAIARCLPDFIVNAGCGRFKLLEDRQLEQYSRRAGALQLRDLIDHLAPRK
ncbi:MAG TPA: hypothetical protein ENI68_05460 [Gammaproteobacteria bacterium]|nr:hypothetical protein [Gammaproteobacteria bacterium]